MLNSTYMLKVCEDVSSSSAATSPANSRATSTLSSVGVSSRRTMISRASASCTTCWLHRCAMNLRQPTAMLLSLRLKAFRNCTATLACQRKGFACDVSVAGPEVQQMAAAENFNMVCGLHNSSLKARRLNILHQEVTHKYDQRLWCTHMCKSSARRTSRLM